jgi:hypothetical protein
MTTCVGTQSPKYLEMAQGHISLSTSPAWRCSPARRWHHKTLLPHVATPFSIPSTSSQFMNWKKVFVAYVCTWFQGTLPLTCLRLTPHARVKTQVMCCSGMPSSLALQTAMVSLGHSLINHYVLHSIVLLLLYYVHLVP